MQDRICWREVVHGLCFRNSQGPKYVSSDDYGRPAFHFSMLLGRNVMIVDIQVGGQRVRCNDEYSEWMV